MAAGYSDVGSEDSWELVRQSSLATFSEIDACSEAASDSSWVPVQHIGARGPLQLSNLALQRTSGRSEVDAVGSELVQLVRQQQWARAQALLQHDPEVLLQDNVGWEVLSWAAYKAGGMWPGKDLVPGALELIWEVLCRTPEVSRQSDPDTGYLPLHDAAWGRAPYAVAVALLAVYPEGMERMTKSNQTPCALGNYIHHRHFGWPEPQVLLTRAGALRDELEDASCCCRTAAEWAEATLRCAPGGSALGPKMTNWCRLQVLPTICETRSHATAAIAETSKSRTRRRNTCCPKPEVSELLIDDSEVSYLRAACKEKGRYSGASRVRHDRCSFSTVCHVAVGARKHCFQRHCVRAVHKEAQRGRAEAKWPCKAAWRRERGRERWDRWSMLIM
eukprot:TRINITY_DN817_c0_g1_i5.p1 TRINITY_DN817_c0_g1~~TRINITY_DN817_c0_g1_i5.p1  ORF type:complete len:390 (-),score=55.65 TRINITY_DN817_c0_g1_i5:295-1464(-)